MTTLLLLFAAYALGTWAPWLAPMRTLFESALYRMLLGLVTVALLTLIIGCVSLSAAWWVVAIAAVGGAALSGRDARAWRFRSPGSEPLDWVEWVSWAATLAGCGFAFICALAPVTGWDAGVAHIALPADYVRNGRIGLIAGNNYAAYPHLMHALYAVAYLGGERDVSLVSWTFGVLACGMAYALGARLAGRKCGLVAAAIIATTPIFTDQAGAPSLDLAFTVTVLAAWHALTAWRKQEDTGWLLLAGIAAGAGCGIRHTGYLVVALLLPFILAGAHERRFRAAFTFACAAVVAAMPWAMRSAFVTGNPLYPFFASLFGTGDLPDVDPASLLSHSSIQGTTLLGLVLFPFRVILDPLRYGGWTSSPGILVLVLGVPGLFVGGREARRLGLFSGLGISAMYFFRRFARYLLPFFAPMAVVAALAVVRAKRFHPVLLIILLLGYGIGLAPGAAMTVIRIPAAVGMASRDAFLSERIERYPAFVWANEHLDTEGTVLTLDPRGYYLDNSTFVNFEALKPLVGMDADERLDWLRAHDIRYLFYPEAYVIESPAFRETGLLEVLNEWRADARHFTLLTRMEIDRPRAEGAEVVEIYEVGVPER
ncbi:MAG: hypothetical protein AMXMBFR82_40370 [Candidatus Hydrogenedentota bacterium]